MNSKENKKRNLALVFTQGVGLHSWLNAGYASREIEYYQDVAEALGGVTFLTYDKNDPDRLENLPELGSIQVRFNSWGLDRRVFSLLAPILKYRSLKHIDVIKTMQHRGSWTALLLKWVLRKPMVARCGYIWSLFEERGGASRSRMRNIRFLEGFVLRRATAVVVPDQFAVDYLSDLHGLAKDKFTILPNFVDIERFVPGDESERVNNQFIFIGRLESDQKRPEIAVAGAAGVPEATLDMIGDGPEWESIKTKTDAMDNVRLHRRLAHSEIAEMMSHSRALVIPSRFEGNPKVVIEALAAGLPIIATKAQGLSEIVEDGVNGILVDAAGESVSAAMRVLMSDDGLWLKLSRNARQLAVEKYSRAGVMEREVSLLNRLIDNQ